MLPNAAYRPSLPPSAFMLASDALTNFLKSVGSVRRPVGGGVTQPGGRLDALASCANAGPGAASVATTARERRAFLPIPQRSRMFIRTDADPNSPPRARAFSNQAESPAIA